MIDHVILGVSSYADSKSFYARALAPIGYELVAEEAGHAGFGRDGKPDFWIYEARETIFPVHVAFGTDSRGPVEAFHVAALAAGGRDHGAPGLREIYHPNYFGAFVLDPDGHNIEVVCHSPA